MIDNLLRDLRHALRQLRRAPGFTGVAVLTLALGIGANIAIFSAIDAVLLRPLPYPDEDRILTLWQHDPAEDVARDDVAPANFLDWRERSRSFETLAAIEPYGLDYLGPEGPEGFDTWLVTEGFFDVLGVSPLLGRTFLPEDHLPGGAPVVVLSYRLWRSRFGGDPQIVGRTLVLDDEPTTVVGVMPPGFVVPSGREMWAPKVFAGWEANNRTDAFWQVVGRLKPGLELQSAQAELDGIAAQLADEHPATNADLGIAAVPLRESLVGHARPALLLLLGAVGAVLLIACVNMANLLLARASHRRREFAIRSALGAGRVWVVRQLATESLVLAGLGGLAGLILAVWGLGVFQGLIPDGFPRTDALGIDGRAVLFTSFLALGSAVLFSLAPGLQLLRTDLARGLHSRGQSATRGARRFRGGLVVWELALAMALLVSSGLLVRSFAALLDVERGYHTENVLAVTVQAWSYYPEPAERSLFVRETLGRISAMPGVVAAGVTSSLPLAEVIGAERAPFTVFGRSTPAPGEEPAVHAAAVTNGYFEALGIPIRSGRLFGPLEADSPPEVLVNETMARRHWPGEDPVGERITFRFMGTPTTAEVVGVVGDVRHAGLHEAPRPSLFLPHVQHPTGALHFTVRTAGDPQALVQGVQEEIWAMNPTMPVEDTATLEGLLAESLGERRFMLLLLLAFSVTALALAAVGTYGVLSYESNRRVREIGVRMAFGAEAENVVRMVVGEGLRLGITGVAIGALLGVVAARSLSGFLFGVSAVDPWTFVGIALLLMGVTVVASYLPARRAAGVDPVQALRAE